MLLTHPMNSTWILRDFMRAITAEICDPEHVAFSLVINSSCLLIEDKKEIMIFFVGQKIIIF